MIDFPRAWQIAQSVPYSEHDLRCSFAQTKGAFLCDCHVLTKHAEYMDTAHFYGADGKIIRVIGNHENKQEMHTNA